MKAETPEIIHKLTEKDALLIIPIPQENLQENENYNFYFCGKGLCIIHKNKYTYIIPYYQGKIYYFLESYVPEPFSKYITSEHYSIQHGIITPTTSYIDNVVDTREMAIRMLDYVYPPLVLRIAKLIIILSYVLSEYIYLYSEELEYVREPREIYEDILYTLPFINDVFDADFIKAVGHNSVTEEEKCMEVLGMAGALFFDTTLYSLISFINNSNIEDKDSVMRMARYQYNYIVSSILESIHKKKNGMEYLKYIDTEDVDDLIEDMGV